MINYTLKWSGHKLVLGPHTTIMGIVNATPDSFSDGGRYFAKDAAVRQAEQLVAAGAGILDIGGESTRPFADEVPAEEEIRRVVPVIEALSGRVSVPISIDTTKAEVAAAAIEAGASMINDIAALQMDPQLAAVAARYEVPVILMHMKGTPRTMQVNPTYDNVAFEVRAFLDDVVKKAVAAGIDRTKIIIDPGIGFGKTGRHNLLLLQRLKELGYLGLPILVGPSRKRFIRDLVKEPSLEDIAPDHPDVETGTQAAVAVAVMNGAHIVRVHDVANTRAMIAVMDAIKNA